MVTFLLLTSQHDLHLLISRVILISSWFTEAKAGIGEFDTD